MFANWLRSSIRLVLTTSYASAPNADIATGDYRPIDLRAAPFRLGPPLAAIEDWVEGFPPRSLMLWELAAIAQPMRRFISEQLPDTGDHPQKPGT